jgi:hypothetical protein
MTSYLVESRLTDGTDGRHLDFATALGLTPGGPVDNPVFFSGFLTRPDVAAAGLLAVADVAAHRYADAGLGHRLANLDPVVTAGGDRLRFESFSACNGVHARFDLLRAALGSAKVGFGTTNVDVNLPLRTALARVNRDEPLHLSVGSDELRASSLAETHVERKVRLPERWIRGFAEVPALTRSMTRTGELRGAAVTRFLAGLPRVAPPGPTRYVLTDGPQWRTSHRPIAGAVPLPGASRLRAADRVARHATALTVYAAPNETAAWVFDLTDARLTLVISPDPYRGFSGEGTLLTLLTRPEGEQVGRRLLPHLDWSPVIEPTELTARAGVSASAAATGLAWLAASGRLGWDLTESAWFHRELPIDTERIVRRNPRLVSAQALVADGGVSSHAAGWQVRGTKRELTCDCAWYRDHPATRGPCKHVLAAVIAAREA